jgi:hypothetical protein
MRCFNDLNRLADARRAAMSNMTIGSSISAAVRRTGEEASRQASAEANAETCAKSKDRC